MPSFLHILLVRLTLIHIANVFPKGMALLICVNAKQYTHHQFILFILLVNSFPLFRPIINTSLLFPSCKILYYKILPLLLSSLDRSFFVNQHHCCWVPKDRSGCVFRKIQVYSSTSGTLWTNKRAGLHGVQ